MKKSLWQRGGEQVLKFALDCTHPTEDSIVDVAIRGERKAGNLDGGVVTIKRSRSGITVSSKVSSSKQYLKYLIKKKISEEDHSPGLAHVWLRIIANSRNNSEMSVLLPG